MVGRTLSGITLTLWLALCLQAQTTSTPGPSPVDVAVRPTGEQRQVPRLDGGSSVSVPVHAVDIRNTSDKCVVAISLRILDKDTEGKLLATGNASLFRQKDGQFNCLEPGQTFSQDLLGSAFDASGRPGAPEVSVDFVIFGDGSTWGPGNDLEQKGYLRGKFDTYKHIQTEKNKKACDTSSARQGLS